MLAPTSSISPPPPKIELRLGLGLFKKNKLEKIEGLVFACLEVNFPLICIFD